MGLDITEKRARERQAGNSRRFSFGKIPANTCKENDPQQRYSKGSRNLGKINVHSSSCRGTVSRQGFETKHYQGEREAPPRADPTSAEGRSATLAALWRQGCTQRRLKRDDPEPQGPQSHHLGTAWLEGLTVQGSARGEVLCFNSFFSVSESCLLVRHLSYFWKKSER